VVGGAFAELSPALIATGGTAIAALTMLTEWGLPASQIKVVSVLGSRQGVEAVSAEFPEVEIWIGAVDGELTEKGYISPGLGDAVSAASLPAYTFVVVAESIRAVRGTVRLTNRETDCSVPPNDPDAHVCCTNPSKSPLSLSLS
jgi:hypothetical protein